VPIQNFLRSLGPALVAASLVSAIGGMPFNVLPQIINSVGSSFQWGPEQLGLFGSSYLGGYFIATLTAPLWIERLHWRRLSWVAVLACVLAMMFTASLGGDQPTAIYVSWAVVGFFAATMTCLGMRVASGMPNKEHGLGSRLGIELLCAAAAFFMLPFAIEAAGYVGAVALLCVVFLLLSVSIFRLPASGRELDSHGESTVDLRISKEGWIGLGVFVLFAIGQIGVYAFLGQLAIQDGVTEAQLSFVLAVLKVIGAVAAIGIGLIGLTFGVKRSHVFAFLGLSGSMLLLGSSGGFAGYAAGAWLWELSLVASCVYQTAAISRLDSSNKAIMLVPAAFALAGTIGPALAGTLVAQHGFGALLTFGAVTAAIPLLMYLPLAGKIRAQLLASAPAV